MPAGIAKTCVCGRRALPGSSRCALHPLPTRSEAERREAQPYREQYTSPEYRRNRTRAIKRARGHCELCGERLLARAQVDHIVPLRDGGSSEVANLQVLCPRCHHLKTLADRRAR